jgi:hypothetical protein
MVWYRVQWVLSNKDIEIADYTLSAFQQQPARWEGLMVEEW